MNYLSIDDVLTIRADVEAKNINSCAVRTPQALFSAIEAPRRAAFGYEFYPTLAEKAGALFYALIQNHPFWDGNKRIATAALQLFLERNNAVLNVDEPTLRHMTRSIALGEMGGLDLARWFDSALRSNMCRT